MQKVFSAGFAEGVSGKVAGLAGSPANAAFAFAGVTFSPAMIVPDTLTLNLH
jgi:hypothetical protein